MIYTKTNRYEIPKEDLEAYKDLIKESVARVDINGQEYYTDGHRYFSSIEISQMLNGSIFPFPETVSLSNKQRLKKVAEGNYEEELIKVLKRPELGDSVYE
jgi:hypothetical protein